MGVAVDSLRRIDWRIVGFRMGRSGGSGENKLNDYFRRRCSNYERFLCDRVWECALCAVQAGKVLSLEPVALPKAEVLRRR